MEALLVIAAFLIVGAPIGLFIWVAVLGRRQGELEGELRRLHSEVARLRELRPTRERDEAESAARIGASVSPSGAAALPTETPAPPTEVPATPSIEPTAAALARELARERPPRRPYDPRTGAVPPPLPSARAATPTSAALAEHAAPAAPTAPLEPAESPAPQAIDWEQWLGVRGAAVVGGIALALAGLFFVQLAIQKGWIGPAMRDGLAVGFGALGLALHSPLRRRGSAIQADALGGAGTVLVYLGAWAAGRLHGLVPMEVAFAVMVATTITAARLALRWSAPVLAAFALIGGFATPVLLDVGARATGALFTYLAVLNAGALMAGRRQGWRWVPRVALTSSALVQVFWYAPAFVFGSAPAVPRAGALAALASVALVYLVATRRAASSSEDRAARRVPPTVLLALAIQVVFAIDLGRTLDVDASILPVGALALLLAVAAHVIARGFGGRALALVGGFGAFALVASWALMHPARVTGDVAQYRRLLYEFGGVALALAATLVALERGVARAGRSAPAAAATAAGLATALAVLVASRGAWPSPWVAALCACGLVSAALLALGRSAAGWLAAPLGALAALSVTSTIAPERGPELWRAAPIADQGASALLALALLGVAVSLRSARAAHATLGGVALAVIALSLGHVGVGAEGEVPRAFVALGIAAALALGVARPRVSPAPSAPSMALGSLGFALATALALSIVLARQAFLLRIGVLPAASARLYALAAGLPALATVAALARCPAPKWHTPIGWAVAAPALVAFSPPVTDFAARAAGRHALAAAYALALVAPLLVGALALALRARRPDGALVAVAGPLLAVAATLAAFAAARVVDVHPVLVGLGCAAALTALLGRALARTDVALAGVAVALAATFGFLLSGLSGRVFLREAIPVAPRLAFVALAVLLGLAAAWAALEGELARLAERRPRSDPRAFVGVALLAATFLWLNLVLLNRFADGERIALGFARAPERDLTLSFGWASYAGALLALGLFKGTRALRWASLAFLLATVLKVFLYDLSSLRGGYRAASFLGLAVALFAVSLVYQRWILPASGARSKAVG